MAAVQEVERAAESGSWLPAYWLCHSEGFRVDSSECGHVGFVEAVLCSPDSGDAEALVVRCGFDGPRTVTVPIEEVVDIRPEESVIVVPALAAHDVRSTEL